jgi:hypothetical protein
MEETYESGEGKTKSSSKSNVTVLTGGFEDVFDEFCLPDDGPINEFSSAFDTHVFLSPSSDQTPDDKGALFDLDINPADYDAKEKVVFSSKEEISLFNYETLRPTRPFRHARSIPPTTYVTPSQVTHTLAPHNLIPSTQPSATISGKSLFELSNMSARDAKMEDEEDEDNPRKPRKERRASPTRTKRAKLSPYPSPPASDDDEDSRPRRNGHVSGYNRKTGELTLVGEYPPTVINGVYYCPLAKCRELCGKDSSWTTKNGYKYHLINVCLQNPNSKRSIKLSQGGEEAVEKPVKNAFWKKCICGGHFKSENGFKLHQKENASTRDGKCLEKMRRKGGNKSSGELSPLLDTMSQSSSGNTSFDLLGSENLGIGIESLGNLQYYPEPVPFNWEGVTC